MDVFFSSKELIMGYLFKQCPWPTILVICIDSCGIECDFSSKMIVKIAGFLSSSLSMICVFLVKKD